MSFYLKNPHFSPKCMRPDPASLSVSLLTCSSSPLKLHSVFLENFCRISGAILYALFLAFFPQALPLAMFHAFLLSQHTYHLLFKVMGDPQLSSWAPCSCPYLAHPSAPGILAAALR